MTECYRIQGSPYIPCITVCMDMCTICRIRTVLALSASGYPFAGYVA